MFVDGDNWVEPSFCELPYLAAIRDNADIVGFNTVTEKRKRKIYRNKKR